MGKISRILGIEIEWRANILALLAFLLSLASIIYNAVGYFEGARIEQYPMTQVILYAHQPVDIRQNDMRLPFDEQTLTFISTMRYVNRGRPRYKDSISGVRLTFYLPGGSGPFQADWHSFVRLDNITDELSMGNSSSALTLAGETADAMEIWLHPRNDSDHITIAEFRKRFESALTKGLEIEWSIHFQSRSDLRGETQTLSGVCRVRVGAQNIQRLSDPAVGRTALNCLHN